jgi:hypothetical protein
MRVAEKILVLLCYKSVKKVACDFVVCTPKVLCFCSVHRYKSFSEIHNRGVSATVIFFRFFRNSVQFGGFMFPNNLTDKIFPCLYVIAKGN